MTKHSDEDRLFDELEARLEEDTRRHPAYERAPPKDIPMLAALFLLSVLGGMIAAEVVRLVSA